MLKRYRHPELGYFNKLDLRKSSVGIALVPDAALAGLVQYLNEAEAERESKRIIRILEEMLELEKIEPPVWSESIDGPMMVMKGGMSVPNPLFRKVAPEKYKLQLEIEKRISVLNRELARHRFLPFAFPHWGGRWLLIWQIQSRARKKVRLHRGVMELDDGRALQMILDLARAGYLNRLRRCSHCRRWLYAKFRHQHFCSTKCQQKHYTQSEEWKAHRREYMRHYYQLTAKPDVKVRIKTKGAKQ